MAKEKSKKVPSLRERLKQKRLELERGSGGKFLTLKEGTTRVRVLPVGEEKDWAIEVVYFYLGVKGHIAVISPATLGKKCAIMTAYKKWKESPEEGDRQLAARLKPSRRYMIPVIKYRDGSDSEIDTEGGKKLLLISSSLYQEAIDLYLDNDNGDFTDPINGYDLKIKRVGKGKMDTKYTLLTGKPRKLDKEYRDPVDLEKLVEEVIPSYEETKIALSDYLNMDPEEAQSNESNTGKTTKKKKSKKKSKGDL